MSGASLSLLNVLFLFIAGQPLLTTATSLNADEVVTLIACYESFFPMTGDPFDYTKGTSDKLILSHQKGQWIEKCLNEGQASQALKEFYSVSDLLIYFHFD